MDLLSHDLAARDGTRLRLWEHGPADADEAVLFYHGAITPSRALLAPPTAGMEYSWLHDVGGRGQHAYAVDIRGFGESAPHPEYDEPPEANEPVSRTDQAALDAADALRHVAENAETVHVVAVSWGTMYAGRMLSGTHPDIDGDLDALVDSLTLCAPVYRPDWEWGPVAQAMGVPTELGAYYVRDRETVRGDQEADALFEATWEATVESTQGIDEDHYLAPAGPQVAVRAATNGDPAFEPADISLPSLVLRGSADALSTREDALRVYDGIDTAGLKEYFELEGSDHYIMHDEHRGAVFDAVYDFQQNASGHSE